MKEKYYPKLYNLSAHFLGLTRIYTMAASLVSLKSGDKLLDAACGTGKLLRIIEKQQVHELTDVKLFGIDLDPDMINRAQADASEGSEIKFKIASVADMPFPPGTFSWLISTLAAHHLNSQEKLGFVKEAYRVLQPGGQILISDLGRPKGVFGYFLAFLSWRHAKPTKNMAEVETNLIQNGFKIKTNKRQFGYVEHLLAEKSIPQNA